ncbi:hypothetical protein [Streptomyces sp. NPDC058086]
MTDTSTPSTFTPSAGLGRLRDHRIVVDGGLTALAPLSVASPPAE